ncbi:hypothetical protein ScPMuIL_017941 [Solemya velum]
MSDTDSSTWDSRTDSSVDTSSAFAEALASQVNKADIMRMVEAQHEMLSRYEKTNEMLINFNMLSSSRYETASHDFSKHTLILSEMKRDLDSIFKRIRILKQRLGKMHPEAFSACSDVFNVLVEGKVEVQDDNGPRETTGTNIPVDLPIENNQVENNQT